MVIDNLNIPKSSFLSTEKDMNLIVEQFLKNERLKRLLYYTTPDALHKPNLSEDQTYGLFGQQIKIVPKLYVDRSVLTYIIISFDNFVQSENLEFRDNIIEFDIICHFDQWQLEDYQLRPYRIAAEIDSVLMHSKRLTGIGRIEFLGANQIILTDEFAGLCLMYRTYHGGEDKKFMPNPADEEQFLDEFNEMMKKK